MSSLPAGALTAVTDRVLLVRPSIPQRTASSRSLPQSIQPRVSVIIPRGRVPPGLLAGVRSLAEESVRGNVGVVEELPQAASGQWVLGFEHDPTTERGSFSIDCSHDDFTAIPAGALFEITVRYNQPIQAFRGLGHVLAMSRSLSSFEHPNATDASADAADNQGWTQEEAQASVKWSGKVGDKLRREEKALFETVGLMVDCSRNGVLLVSAVKFILRQLALSGTNMLQLYCEDTYAVPGEPFFGYFRGPYTEAEFREIDDYAFDLGIEVVPCIQTLGHLGQMLQWPKYGILKDTSDCILPGAQETYTLIEKMIKAVTAGLRSKRIHIGMDEAHGVSEGRYRQIFGYKDSTKVFVDHLRQVNHICQQQGLRPMIWSDMLFCLPAKNNALSGYYDLNSVIPDELSSSMPDDVDLVFWDYYHSSPDPYKAKIAQHWQLANKAPMMASGIWTWSRHWTALPFTFATIKASMKASKAPDAGVTQVMATIWGDEGNECDIYSALPGVWYHAEQAYTTNDEVDADLLRLKFDGCAGANFDDFVYAAKLDDTQPEAQVITSSTHYTPNMSKYLLWEEPFFSFLSPQYRGYNLEAHYDHLATYLEQATSAEFSTMTTVTAPHSIVDYPANARLRLPLLLARVLALKAHLRERLVHAYRQGDGEELEALAGAGGGSRMGRLRALVQELHEAHRANWFGVYKPFGWEVLDLRYGGLRARLETMHDRCKRYVDRGDESVTRLEELEVELEVVYPGQGANLMLDYARCSRPQCV